MGADPVADQGWSDTDDLYRHQERGIARVLRAASRSPFYGRSIHDASDAWAALRSQPLTTKDDLRQHYPEGFLAVERTLVATYHESSGTSGRPTASWYSTDDWNDLAERFARKWVGIHAEDTLMVRTPYSMMITGHLAHAGARLRGAVVVPADNRTSAMPYSRVVRTLADLRVTLTWSMPTEPFIWAAACREAGLNPATDFPALRALFLGGELLTPQKRRRLEELWNVPVVEEYGSTETGTLAGACQDGALHLWADRVVFEVHDPTTGSVATEGRGELVVTPLHRQAMPLLRYNLGDEVEIIRHQRCTCGSAFPTVRVLGRADDTHAVGCTSVSQRDLESEVFSLPSHMGVLFWRAQVRDQHLTLEIEVDSEHCAEACQTLTTRIRQRVGVPTFVSAVAPGSLLPTSTLIRAPTVAKPRFLFGPGEDWTSAVHYQ